MRNCSKEGAQEHIRRWNLRIFSVRSKQSIRAIDPIVLKPWQMLIGQNKTSSVESTAIIDQAVVHGREHIDIQSGKIQMLQADTTLIRFIEPDTFPFRDLVASASFSCRFS